MPFDVVWADRVWIVGYTKVILAWACFGVGFGITSVLPILRELENSGRAGLEIVSGEDELQRHETLRPQSAWPADECQLIAKQ